jgi:hypothetical protein
VDRKVEKSLAVFKNHDLRAQMRAGGGGRRHKYGTQKAGQNVYAQALALRGGVEVIEEEPLDAPAGGAAGGDGGGGGGDGDGGGGGGTAGLRVATSAHTDIRSEQQIGMTQCVLLAQDLSAAVLDAGGSFSVKVGTAGRLKVLAAATKVITAVAAALPTDPPTQHEGGKDSSSKTNSAADMLAYQERAIRRLADKLLLLLLPTMARVLHGANLLAHILGAHAAAKLRVPLALSVAQALQVLSECAAWGDGYVAVSGVSAMAAEMLLQDAHTIEGCAVMARHDGFKILYSLMLSEGAAADSATALRFVGPLLILTTCSSEDAVARRIAQPRKYRCPVIIGNNGHTGPNGYDIGCSMAHRKELVQATVEAGSMGEVASAVAVHRKHSDTGKGSSIFAAEEALGGSGRSEWPLVATLRRLRRIYEDSRQAEQRVAPILATIFAARSAQKWFMKTLAAKTGMSEQEEDAAAAVVEEEQVAVLTMLANNSEQQRSRARAGTVMERGQGGMVYDNPLLQQHNVASAGRMGALLEGDEEEHEEEKGGGWMPASMLLANMASVQVQHILCTAQCTIHIIQPSPNHTHVQHRRKNTIQK